MNGILFLSVSVVSAILHDDVAQCRECWQKLFPELCLYTILRFFRPLMERARTVLSMKTSNTDMEMINHHIRLTPSPFVWKNLQRCRGKRQS